MVTRFNPLVTAIRDATILAMADRNAFTESVVFDLTKLLHTTQKKVHRVMLRTKSHGSVPENRLAKTKGLRRLEREIDAIIADLNRDSSLLFRRTMKTSYGNGIKAGAFTLAKAGLPFYRDLKPDGLDKLKDVDRTVAAIHAHIDSARRRALGV